MVAILAGSFRYGWRLKPLADKRLFYNEALRVFSGYSRPSKPENLLHASRLTLEN